MNLSKMMKLCKKHRHCFILTVSETGVRYLTDGTVYARLDAGTEFTSSDALVFMELSESQLDGFEHGDNYFVYEFGGFVNSKYQTVNRLPINLSSFGGEFIPFNSHDGLMLIDKKKYEIFEYGATHQCYYGSFGNSVALIIPGNGGVVDGVIIPSMVDTQKMSKVIGCVYSAAKKAYENKFCDCGHHQMTMEELEQ